MSAADNSYRIVAGFPEDQRGKAATLYWEAFSGKLGLVMGPGEKARAFFASTLDPDFVFSALGGDGQLLGLAGFKTSDGAFAGGEWSDLSSVYGFWGSLWRVPLLTLLERDLDPELLLMDGILVDADARGMGIGSALLDRIAQDARARGLRGVRLDVIDDNPRARALYERKGFVAGPVSQLGPLRWVFGFRTSTCMILPIGAD